MRSHSVVAGFVLSAHAVSGNLRAQTPVTYVYDDLGRLVSVVDSTGSNANFPKWVAATTTRFVVPILRGPIPTGQGQAGPGGTVHHRVRRPGARSQN